MGAVTLSSAQWTPIGPAPIDTKGGLDQISGRIQAAAPDPNNPTTIYVGGDNGGVWKSTTTPPSWTPLTDTLSSLGVSGYPTLVVHPANSNLVLGLVSGPGAGVLQSGDGGNTWQILANSQFNNQFLTALPVHPTNQNTLYLAASWFGAWQSAVGGQTWRQITTLPSGSVWDLVVAKYDSNTLFAAIVGNTGAQQAKNGVYKSTDSGTTWTLLPGLPSGSALGQSNSDGSSTVGAVRIETGTASGALYVAMLTVAANPSPPFSASAPPTAAPTGPRSALRPAASNLAGGISCSASIPPTPPTSSSTTPTRSTKATTAATLGPRPTPASAISAASITLTSST
jgi:hypothetical protein